MNRIEEINQLLNEYYYKTEPKQDPNIEMYVCEETADLHFIDNTTRQTMYVIKCEEY